jgi:hypothetical protein
MLNSLRRLFRLDLEFCSSGRRWIGMTWGLFLLIAALLTFIPRTASAEETGTAELPDRIMIRGGWAYIFNADTIFGINSNNGVSASADFSQLLGGDRQDNVWRADSYYRFNPRHSLGLSYYDVERRGDKELLQDITIDNTTYSAGAQIKTDIGVSLYRLFYNYSFVHDEKTELQLSGGLYVANMNLKLNANFTCTGGPTCSTSGGPLVAGGSTTTQTVPLPSFGFQTNYHITPRLLTQFRLEWFYIEASTFQGAMSDFYLGIEYRALKHFALGTAFDRFNVDVSYSPDTSRGWRVLNNWNSLYLYGALYF